MKNTKLIALKENIERGAILRCKGKYPYEDYVDFMVIESSDEGKLVYSLLVVSGYKAGLTFVMLPQESIPERNEGYAINTAWLCANWNKWGYFECLVEDVHVVYKDPPVDFYD
ncbi:Imm45 family immunity protein [Chitinophaga sp. 212800010-3]|uniref:Imm45 family immunity protein n=1 Tax=unclassified Chitinophaga TaxID=2619133 RepID=UPI002DEC41AA|nr:Imm45 domain-containing protein [Chitinophaga sp. 212800010-3]